MQLLFVLGSDSAGQGCYLISVALKIVIKSQLCIGRNVFCGKQANGQFTVHQPLLCLTVGITGVVDEPAQSPLNAMMPSGAAQQLCTSAQLLHDCIAVHVAAERLVVCHSASSAGRARQ